jgi:hypothetical protein
MKMAQRFLISLVSPSDSPPTKFRRTHGVLLGPHRQSLKNNRMSNRPQPPLVETPHVNPLLLPQWI